MITRLPLYVIAFALVVHGLIQLMGLVAYWPLGALAELPYKAALLKGRWEVGQNLFEHMIIDGGCFSLRG